ncbi:hypothetical protein RFI_23439 [Reticulomyxa filosa]|uniref:Uncharacterized protein n=1 Tax=Reticulomyxa filosa TaxID=46433 RepID=X6MLJ8_RETFI|nr:hypothetical protein RFI_23439 [Reticulomyxa filosa]|eukprot:ETO13930.1 hypothetical protein RFI_23439 [Reticulomyxa filosa]
MTEVIGIEDIGIYSGVVLEHSTDTKKNEVKLAFMSEDAHAYPPINKQQTDWWKQINYMTDEEIRDFLQRQLEQAQQPEEKSQESKRKDALRAVISKRHQKPRYDLYCMYLLDGSLTYVIQKKEEMTEKEMEKLTNSKEFLESFRLRAKWMLRALGSNMSVDQEIFGNIISGEESISSLCSVIIIFFSSKITIHSPIINNNNNNNK